MSEIVHLQCNDPDNGMFAGRLWGADYRDMELRHDDWFRGCSIAFLPGNKVRISRRTFSYQDMREWVGNWCWNAISMDRREAHRLILYLRDSGWECEGGPTRLFDWWNHKPAKARNASITTREQMNMTQPGDRKDEG